MIMKQNIDACVLFRTSAANHSRRLRCTSVALHNLHHWKTADNRFGILKGDISFYWQ
jgi:hypothetical protein